MAHSKELADYVKQTFAEDRPYIIGPSAANVGKISDVYRNIFYIKHTKYAKLINIKNAMENFIKEKEWNADTVQFDFDPMSAY